MLGQFCEKLKIRAHKKTDTRGVSLIEIVLALALFSVAVVLVFSSQWTIGDLLLNNAKTIAGVNIAGSNLVNSLFGLEGEEYSDGRPEIGVLGILSTLQILPFTRCQKIMDAQSFWQTGWQTFSTTSISYLSTDLDLVAKYGFDCEGQPKEFSEDGIVLEETIDLGFSAVAVDVFENNIFSSMRPSAGTNGLEPEFAVSTLSFPNVSVETELTNVVMGSGENGIHKIDAINDFVFSANNSTTSQLAVFHVLDPSGSRPPEIELAATSTLPGVTGSRPEAVSIFYFDSRIYIGTKRTAGHEFHIFDVSNPNRPRWLGSREMNHNINDIVVKGDFAFLATSGNVRDLIILDVRDPTAISQVLTVDLPGNEDGRSIQISAHFVFLGRYKATQPGRDELCVLKYWIDPDDGSLGIDLVQTIATGADTQGISVFGEYVFAATSNPLKELQIFKWNQSGHLELVSSRNLSFPATSIDFKDGYFAVTSGNELLLFNLSIL